MRAIDFRPDLGHRFLQEEFKVIRYWMPFKS